MQAHDDIHARLAERAGDVGRDLARTAGSVLAIAALLTMVVDECRKLGASGGEVTR